MVAITVIPFLLALVCWVNGLLTTPTTVLQQIVVGGSYDRAAIFLSAALIVWAIGLAHEKRGTPEIEKIDHLDVIND